MYYKTINEIRSIVFDSEDYKCDFYTLIKMLVGQSSQTILDFTNVASDWPLANLLNSIKTVGLENGVQFVIINCPTGLAKEIPPHRIPVLANLIEAIHFLTGKDLIKCQCNAWLPFSSLTTFSIGPKWRQAIVCPSCGLLHDRDGQPIKDHDCLVYSINGQIKLV